MFRIDVATAAGVIPTPAAAGTPGYFTNGNPATSTPSTVVDADFLNMVQEELMAIVVAASITPSKTTRNQVLTAINALIAGATGAGAIQAQAGNYAAAGGTANAITATFTPAVAAHVTGMPLRVKIATTNTTPAVTLNPGPGIKSVKTPNGQDPKPGDLRAGAIVELEYDGTNYQITGTYNPIGRLASPTAGITVDASDWGTVFRFNGLSADATVALPALSAVPDGFEFTVWNDDAATDFGVIVDPNSTEQIDGFSTRKGHFGTRVTIIKESGMWRTKSGKFRYCSGDQTITLAGTLTLAHGLGTRPRNVWVEIKNSSAEFNYSVGDIVPVQMFESNAAGGAGCSLVADATNLVVRYASNSSWTVANKTSGANQATTAASWKARFYAEE